MPIGSNDGNTYQDDFDYLTNATPMASAEPVTGGNMVVDSLLHGIGQRETGGEKDPYGNITDAGNGHSVYGKYQIEDSNIGPWTREALGTAMSPQDFLGNASAQDTVARYKLNQYVQQYGPEGAAQAWLGGPGSVGKTSRTDKFGTSVGQYGQDVMRLSGLSNLASGQDMLHSQDVPQIQVPEQQEETNPLMQRVLETWPVQAAKGLYNAVTLPGDVYQGKASAEDIPRVTGLGLATIGGDLPGLKGLIEQEIPFKSALKKEVVKQSKDLFTSPLDIDKAGKALQIAAGNLST